MYRKVSFTTVFNTLSQLSRRIEERFPNSGLAQVSRDLEQIFQDSHDKLRWISKPHYPLRAAVAVVLVAGISLMTYSVSLFDFTSAKLKTSEWVAISESLLNETILIGAALFFLFTLEAKIKRSRALSTINELRALAHVVDMHQLTKDPAGIGETSRTASSPERSKSPYELSRYLDYCSELLSMISKLAAIYAERLPEPDLVSAVNDIENLTNGLSRKVWQKINILQIHHGDQLRQASQVTKKSDQI